MRAQIKHRIRESRRSQNPVLRTIARLRTGLMIAWASVAALLFCPASVRAQQSQQSASQGSQSASETSQGVQSGDYNVQQALEFGYRDSLIGGNIANYDTFENLGSGFRLFDYTLDMHSIDHHGLFFDNLSFSNFGYGGDPNDVSRLRISKGKLYDFRVLFRRDKNFWNYNLLANPLNPASSVPALAITSSPHSLDLVRRMQDYDLTLFPLSKLRFRLGYSRNVNEGPGFTTLDGGTEPLLAQDFHYTTNSYRFGGDYRLTRKTTLSFDELLSYFKQDNTVTDRNFPFVLSNGTPADLGIVFNTGAGTPCKTPILDGTTTPPTANANCNGYLSYSRVGRPRGSFPTERFSFQSSDIKSLEMSGSLSYSSDRNSTADFLEVINSWTSRSVSRGGTTAGPSSAERVSVRADWSGDYRLTSNLHLLDEFHYDNWRIPSMWDTAETNLFATPPAAAGQSGLLLPIAQVNPANFASLCPAPFNGPNCPQHNSSSPPDIVNELVSQFLGQNIKANTIEVEYQVTNRIDARIGYAYRNRTIADYSATFDLGEFYFPGGADPDPSADNSLAARADCAKVSGVLPSDCTINPDGSIVEGSPSNPIPERDNDSLRNLTQIHENALLLGVSARPSNNFRIGADFMFGYNDNSFTRVSPRQIQSYKIHATYTPKSWATIDGSIDIHENRDNVFTVNNLEHGRTYSFATSLAPSQRFFVDFGYSYIDIFTQTDICFAEPGSTVFTTACPVAGATGPLGATSFYTDTDHYAYADMLWKPYKRITATLGYSGTIARGNTLFLNPRQPTGPLDFNYLKPSASLMVDLYKGVSYKTAWNYYGYNDHGVPNPAGLALLPLQDFNGNNITFSLRYAF
ncbi:MAG TPA: hypothetical protein VJ731_00460 [Terriglobales bacterium]|nr:hypothetical protein [Terriglobales bacterium]